MWQFLHNDDIDYDGDGAKATAIPRIFSENSRAKNVVQVRYQCHNSFTVKGFGIKPFLDDKIVALSKLKALQTTI